MKILRNVLFFVLAIITVILCGASYIYGGRIAFSVQWPLYEALRNTAAIIFAVVGAWLAIIYPERLRMSLRDSVAVKEQESPNMRLLLTPAVSSAFILIVILAVGIASPLLRQSGLAHLYVAQLRGFSFCLLMFLTIWQIVIVVISILPVDFLLQSEAEEKARGEIDRHYGSLRQRVITERKHDDK